MSSNHDDQDARTMSDNLSGQQQPDQSAMPALGVEEMLHWGVAPDGKNVVLIVQSASQGPVRLAMSAQVLTELVNAGQLAKLQAAKNAQVAGDDMLAVTPVDSFKVASLAGGKMTMLILAPNTPNEMAYGLTNPASAIAMGRALVQEGMNAQRIGDAVSGKKNGIVHRQPRILRPH